MNLCFLDTETTGLDPVNNRVIELSMEITSPYPVMETLLDYTTKIRLSPADEASASPRALEVNGYSRDAWAVGVESNIGFWARVHSVLSGVVPVVQNYPFDCGSPDHGSLSLGPSSMGFISGELARFKLRPSWDRRYIELYSYTHLIADELNVVDDNGRRTWNLQTVYKALAVRNGWPPLEEHRARGDRNMVKRIYRYVKERWALHGV